VGHDNCPLRSSSAVQRFPESHSGMGSVRDRGGFLSFDGLVPAVGCVGGLGALGCSFYEIEMGCGGERGSVIDKGHSYLPPILHVRFAAHRAELGRTICDDGNALVV
jgi:hypothetical protein